MYLSIPICLSTYLCIYFYIYLSISKHVQNEAPFAFVILVRCALQMIDGAGGGAALHDPGLGAEAARGCEDQVFVQLQQERGAPAGCW